MVSLEAAVCGALELCGVILRGLVNIQHLGERVEQSELNGQK